MSRGNTPQEQDEPLLAVRNLAVSFSREHQVVEAVRGVSFEIRRGQIVAIVGESGSGKSVTARSLVGLAGDNAAVRAQALSFDGIDLRVLGSRQWRSVRGGRIGFVLQDAMGSLDPLRSIAAEVAEPLREHRTVERGHVEEEVVRLLAEVGIPQPRTRLRQYSHQLSGGLRQRALIASALAARPDLLIADEPTTALDMTVQKQVLALLRERTADGTAMLLISHDLAVVAELADHVYVMRGGVFVEQGTTRTVLDAPRHTYTRQLLAAASALGAHGSGTPAPSASASATPVSVSLPPDPAVPADPAPVVLAARGLVKTYHLPGRQRLTAVDDVSFVVRAGETVGLVGESGSGKTTVGRMLMGLVAPDAGEVRVDGVGWNTLDRAARRATRRRVQMIYQDPLGSFDPRYTAHQILAEPLRVSSMSSADRAKRVRELLEHVGLGREVLPERARALSGGQRQRLAIARALAPEPEVIVCDEPVSALDVSIQAQVLEVFRDVQARLGVAYVFISHHLGVVHYLSHRVVVLHRGRVVEQGAAEQVFGAPRHPYTQALLAAVPQLETTF
ncbi:ABC transporter ATP-binding protein [Frankia sp. QA3]|uniref:dipeptide ABC transporter ATP-binding protein n=1 Tax=Frankia sp. QA3 TaxID=710111 RepID=UPI000269C189|nr:ABC transporter ATP-binding protein [Frankia sp. QA3]EIV92559.1 ATPase component of various ABC-type transport systems with duplicated ATPase domain [Frankia sp. QA3]